MFILFCLPSSSVPLAYLISWQHSRMSSISVIAILSIWNGTHILCSLWIILVLVRECSQIAIKRNKIIIILNVLRSLYCLFFFQHFIQEPDSENYDHCPSDMSCSALPADCVQCDFNCTCVYGQRLNVTCKPRPKVQCQQVGGKSLVLSILYFFRS